MSDHDQNQNQNQNQDQDQDQEQDIVHGLAASPCYTDDGLCFMARHSGLYRSDDGGATWRSAFDAFELHAPLPTTVVVFSPDFAADQTVFAGVFGGILRSADAGRSWSIAVLPSPPPLVSSLAVSPDYARDGIVHAGTVEDGAYRSADRGGSWTPWNFGLLDLRILALAISPDYANDETIYAGTETGLFLSTNGGRAWRETAFPTDVAPILSLALSPGYAADQIVFAGTESHGLWRSDDGGASWERRSADIMDGSVNGIVLSPDFPTLPDLLAVLGTTVLLSRDGGRSWSDGDGCLRVEEGIVTVAAPHGLAPGGPVLIASIAGEVTRVTLPE